MQTRNFLSLTIMGTLSTIAFGIDQTMPYFDDESLIVDVSVEDQPGRFILDSGSSFTALFANGLDRLELDAVQSPSLTIAGEKVQIRRTAEHNVKLFGMHTKARLAVLPFRHRYDGVVSWRDIPGAIFVDGYNRRVLAVNKLPSRTGWQTWKLEKENSQLFFVVTDDDKPLGRVFIDTGVAGGLRLSPALWNEWKARHPDQPTTLETFQYAVGDTMVSEVAWVPNYEIGNLQFYDLDIGLIPTAKNQTVVDANGKEYFGTIGMRALRHMRLIIDLKNGELLTQPVSGLPTFNRLGAVFVPIADGAKLGCRTTEGTPAHRAGLRNGDVLLAIGERVFDRPDRQSIHILTRLLAQPAGTMLNIRYSRNGSEHSAQCRLQDILKKSYAGSD